MAEWDIIERQFENFYERAGKLGGMLRACFEYKYDKPTDEVSQRALEMAMKAGSKHVIKRDRETGRLKVFRNRQRIEADEERAPCEAALKAYVKELAKSMKDIEKAVLDSTFDPPEPPLLERDRIRAELKKRAEEEEELRQAMEAQREADQRKLVEDWDAMRDEMVTEAEERASTR